MTCLEPKLAWRYKYMRIEAGKDEKLHKEMNRLHFGKMPNDTGGIEILDIPCGKCLGCRLDKANEWAVRMYLESKRWKNACFITLTYNEQNLPKDKKLHPRDITLFLKRLRKAEKGIEVWTNPKTHKEEQPIRYLYCGEYGTKTKRPHYHMALFNYIPNDLKFYKTSNGSDEKLYISQKIQKLWGKGFTPIGQMTYQSACYIARYVQKKAYSNEKTDEFIRMSRMPGLGISEWTDNKNMLKKTGNILVNIKNAIKIKQLPRYFKKLWEAEDWYSFEEYRNNIKEKGKINAVERLKQYSTSHCIDDRREIALHTLKNDLEAKAKLLVRKL